MDSTKVKNIVKSLENDFYNKIILLDDLKQCEYLLLNFEYKTIDRVIHNIEFPIGDNLKKSFISLQNNTPLIRNKAFLKDSLIRDKCDSIKSEKVHCSPKDIRLEFPIETDNNRFVEKQQLFYLQDSVKTCSCKECSGDGLVSCYDSVCNGNHTWECDECIGEGKVSCPKCSGEGWNRCGGLFTGCGGSGKVKKTVRLASGKTSEKLVNCSSCSGKGKVKCMTCNVTGKVTCSKCSGKRTITCNYCYEDRKRYGLTDCRNCDGKGEFGELDFVVSKIENKKHQKIIIKGPALQLDLRTIEDYFSHLNDKKELFYQHNTVVKNDYSEFEKKHCEILEQELNLDKNSFPKVLTEKLAYKHITCIEFNYKHILSNEIHSGVIIDYNSAPRIKLYSDPEELKMDLKNAAKTTTSFLSKIFKTKKFKLKTDRLIEIKLMIYLAKADGKIEESEKIFLSEIIKNLDDFTNTEKKELFTLMDTKVLPELTAKDLKFSSNDIENQIIGRLNEMAMVDGEFEPAEIRFIENLKNKAI
jgi:uncharacterized tellurite resistance protein B-like protein